MPTDYKAMNKAELLSVVETFAPLLERTFDWAGETKTIGDTSMTALHYLIAYGARQSSSDTEAGFASFVGVKDDGSVPANAMTAKKRGEIAKELGRVGYDDSIDARKELAELYFAKANADKWARIVDGSLTVGSRTRLNADESRMAEMAEQELLTLLNTKGKSKAAATKARRESRAELIDAKDPAVWRTIVEDFLEANRELFATRLAKEKAERAAHVGNLKTDGFVV